MRLAAFVAAGVVVVSCSAGGSPASTAGSPAVESKASDLRTGLDLLLGEHVMLLAKVAEAAVNQNADYAPYATILTANAAALETLTGVAFGNTTAQQLARTWDQQDGYLVDYAVGLATHDEAKSRAAMLTLRNEFVPGFAQQLADASGLSSTDLSDVLGAQLALDRSFLDELAATDYARFYADLHRAYTQTATLGDELTTAVSQRYPDKFPGDPQDGGVSLRVSMNLLLQEASYTLTLATAAAVAVRAAELVAATNALKPDQNVLASLVPGNAFNSVWTARTRAMIRYATGQDAAKQELTATFVDAFVSSTDAPVSAVTNQLNATLKVVDDQRAKATADVAGDDRTAAAAMQPLADSLSEPS